MVRLAKSDPLNKFYYGYLLPNFLKISLARSQLFCIDIDVQVVCNVLWICLEANNKGNCCSCMQCTLYRLWAIAHSLRMYVWYESLGSCVCVCVHAHICLHRHLFQGLVMEAHSVKIKIELCKDRRWVFSATVGEIMCLIWYLVKLFDWIIPVINYLNCWKCDMEIQFIMSKMCDTHLSPVYLNTSPFMPMVKCKLGLFPI